MLATPLAGRPADPPVLTRVVNLAFGPSVSSAAIAVASLVVEAGVKPVPGLSSYRTWPVDRFVTSAPTCGPRLPEFISASRLAETPATVATPPGPVPGEPVTPRSVAPGPARPAWRTCGMS